MSRIPQDPPGSPRIPQDPHCSAYHQVLNRAHWSPLQASRSLLTRIIHPFVPAGGRLDIVIDETLERRWGAKIRKRGQERDSALSSHARSVSSPGLRWIVLDRAGSCWIVLDRAGSCWIVLDRAGSCWIVLDRAGSRRQGTLDQ